MSSSESIATPSRPTSPSRARVVGVVAHQRRHVERRREPRLAVIEQVAEALVRLRRRAEAGELPHRPELAAVHRRIDPAREREHARIAEVAVVVDRDRVGRHERIVLQPGDRREELPLPLRGAVVQLLAPRAVASSESRSSVVAIARHSRRGRLFSPDRFRPMNGRMRSLVATVLCAVTLVSLAGTAAAARPDGERGSLPGSSRHSSARSPRPPSPSSRRARPAIEARRAALAVRGYARLRPGTRRGCARRARHRRDAATRSRPLSSQRNGRSRCTTRGRAASTCSGTRRISGRRLPARS